MNYESWNNRQVSMAVAMVREGVEFNENAEPLFAVDCFYGGSVDSHGCYVVWTGCFESEYFDPCNNPSDAWPIIVENKINIEWRDSLKLHPLAKGTGGNACHWSDRNPLRAAMICFLKMKDAENDR